MIVSAAVKIRDLRQDKEIIIPCHRHCNAFYILKEFGYKKNIDYKEIAQGFLDEHDKFYNRVEAWKHAWWHRQIKADEEEYHQCKELFSEDLW